MKTSSEPLQPTPNKQPTAKACLLANALILPGAGSLMRGKKEGYVQVTTGILGLVISGFSTMRLVQFMGKIPLAPVDPDTAISLFNNARPELIWAIIGLAVFGFGWVWSLFTSAAIFREDRKAGG